jgi:hypothetical protein
MYIEILQKQKNLPSIIVGATFELFGGQQTDDY